MISSAGVDTEKKQWVLGKLVAVIVLFSNCFIFLLGFEFDIVCTFDRKILTRDGLKIFLAI